MVNSDELKVQQGKHMVKSENFRLDKVKVGQIRYKKLKTNDRKANIWSNQAKIRLNEVY